MTMCITEWVTIARSGPTIDGREIPASVLMQIAESYNPATYTAVLNYDHAYGNLGTVRELRTEKNGDAVELQARIRPNEYFYMYNKAEMGIFFSVEFVRNFAKTGKAYLTGLAVTNNPASLGTTEVHLSAQKDEQVEMAAVVKPGKIEVVEMKNSGLKNFLSNAIKDVFKSQREGNDMTKEELTAAFAAALKPINDEMAALTKKIDEYAAGKDEEPEKEPIAGKDKEPEKDAAKDKPAEDFAALQTKLEGLSAKFDAISTKLEELAKTKPGKAGTPDQAADQQSDFIL